MALPQGIAFRATSGYVTDGANEDPQVVVTADYPRTSAQGNTIGWEQAAWDKANRNAGLATPKLAGINYMASTSKQSDYRIDLPSTGSYNIRLAAGDAGGANPIKIGLKDSTTEFVTISHAAPSSNQYYDATDVLRTSDSDWNTNNATANRTFASTIFRTRVGDGATENCVIAYVYIESAGGGGGPVIPVFMNQYRQRWN